jgi:hypothetical protein
MLKIGKQERRCAVNGIRKLFCAIAAALHAVVSLDEYMDILSGYGDKNSPDEHEECWQ